MSYLRAVYFGALRLFIVACVVGIVTLIFGNVVLRYLLNSGLPFSEEASRFMFVWLIFAGALLVLHEHGHIGIFSLVRALPDAMLRLILLLAYGLMLFATWLLLRGSWEQTLINLHVPSPVTGLPVAFLYGTGVIFAAASGLVLVYQALGALRASIEILRCGISQSEDEAEVNRAVRETASGE